MKILFSHSFLSPPRFPTLACRRRSGAGGGKQKKLKIERPILERCTPLKKSRFLNPKGCVFLLEGYVSALFQACISTLWSIHFRGLPKTVDTFRSIHFRGWPNFFKHPCPVFENASLESPSPRVVYVGSRVQTFGIDLLKRPIYLSTRPIYSPLHLECHFFNLESPSSIQFSRSLFATFC